jgi:hypothetical protein
VWVFWIAWARLYIGRALKRGGLVEQVPAIRLVADVPGFLG